MLFKRLFRRFFGTKPWKQQWLDELNTTLHEAQAGLPANVVVIVTRESDMYAEVLFLLSFLGLIAGSIAAIFLKTELLSPEDLISLPLMGFAAGSTLYHFRRFFLSRLAPKSIREKVLAKAKALFLDQIHNVKGKLVLFYFSEVEREAVILASPEMDTIYGSADLKRLLHNLSQNYQNKDPLKALGPALRQLGEVLKIHLGSGAAGENFVRSFRSLLGPSDVPNEKIIPILKGNNDIN
jgi:uncharacterized membrane protein